MRCGAPWAACCILRRIVPLPQARIAQLECHGSCAQEATGLFTDYHWQAHCCADAAEAATVLHSAEAASAHLERPLHGARDVWMGVDCYGRGTWGGGGMNCDAALACALRAGTSVAMFAAAWAYAEHAAAERERENWRFWTLAVKACAPRPTFHTLLAALATRLHASRVYEPECKLLRRWQGRRVMVHQLPLCTSFNRGTGAAYAMNGAAVHSAAWLNLSLQDAQPQWLQRGGRFETAAGVVAREPYGETQRRAHCVFEGSAGYECAAELAGGTAWSEELYACDAPVSGDTLHVTYACVVRGEEGLADCAVSLTFEDPGGGDNATAVLGPAGFSERGVVVCAATGELSAGEMQHRTCMEPVSTEEVRSDVSNTLCACLPAAAGICSAMLRGGSPTVTRERMLRATWPRASACRSQGTRGSSGSCAHTTCLFLRCLQPCRHRLVLHRRPKRSLPPHTTP